MVSGLNAIEYSVISKMGLLCCATSKVTLFFRRAPVNPKNLCKMGKNSFADFISALKSLARKAEKKLVKGAKILAMVLLFVVTIAYFAVGNVVVLATAVIWMPLAFILQPAWLARKINKKASDDPIEFFMEVRLASVITIGCIFKWLGTRSWCTRKQRFAFLEEFTPGLKGYPTKVQVQYWEDCSYQENNFRLLSEEARVDILVKLLGGEMYQVILKHMKVLNPVEKGEFIRSLIGALQVCDSADRTAAMFKLIIKNYTPNEFTVLMLKEEEFEYLWNSISAMKLFVLYTRGMNMEYLRRLVKNENMPELEGIRLLEQYVSNKTLNSSHVSYLVKEAIEDANVSNILAKIIIKNGLTAQLLDEVYKTKKQGFISDVVEALAVYTDCQMIKGVADENMSFIARMNDNEQRWSKYCAQRQISEIAQVKMSHDQYKAFRASGQHLGEKSLELLLVRLTELDKDYFSQLVSDEYENLNSKLKAIISTVPWKARIWVDVTAQKA